MARIVIVKDRGVTIGIIGFFVLMIVLVLTRGGDVFAGKSEKFPDRRFEVVAHSRSCVDIKEFPNYNEKDNKDCIDGRTSLWDIDVIRDVKKDEEFTCLFYDKEMACFKSRPDVKNK